MIFRKTVSKDPIRLKFWASVVVLTSFHRMFKQKLGEFSKFPSVIGPFFVAIPLINMVFLDAGPVIYWSRGRVGAESLPQAKEFGLLEVI